MSPLRTSFNVCEQPLEPGTWFLIEASAGTGKTFNIQHLYLRLILEKNLTVGEILAVTFTEAATAELRTRIRSNLERATAFFDSGMMACEDEILRSICTQASTLCPCDELRRRAGLALVSFDEAAIFTIHGFCSRMLNENAFESHVSFDLELIEDQREIIADVVRDFWRRNFYEKNGMFVNLLERQGFSPGHLIRFAVLVASKPDLRLVSSIPDNEPYELSDADLTRLFTQCLNRFLSLLPPIDKERKSNDKQLVETLKDSPDLSLIEMYETIGKISFNVNWLKQNPELKLRQQECLNLPISLVKRSLKHILFDTITVQKAALRLQSYDDMLLDFRTALRDRSGKPSPNCALANRLRTRYKAAMIDEFQDTDPVQYEIFRTIFRHEQSLFIMIGDPKQSIYRFRNADIYAYLEAQGEADSDVKTLTTNFRSSQGVLDGINELFKKDGAFVESGIAYDAIQSGRTFERILVLPDDEEEGAAVKPFQMDWVQADEPKGISKTNVDVIEFTADRVVDALHDFRWRQEATGAVSEVRPSDIAILLPTNFQTSAMRTALKRRGVPAVISSSGNVFKSDMAAHMHLLLRAILNPGNPKYLKSALIGPFFRFSPEELIRWSDGTNETMDRLSFWADRFREFAQIWENKGVMPMLSRILSEENLHVSRTTVGDDGETEKEQRTTGLSNLAHTPLSFDGLDNRERSIVDARHLMELLHRLEKEQRLSPSLLMATLKRKVMSDAGDDDGDAVETRLETDRDSVRIMTIHKSKGLQFPLVFCPLLWDKHFGLDVKFDKHRDWFCHDVGRGASEESKRELILPLGDSNKNTYSDQGMRELLGELVRVAYVAVTRAENYCRVLYGRFGNVSTQTSLNYLFGNQTPDSFIQCASLAENDPPETDSIQMFPVSEATVVHRTEPNPYRPPAEATCVPLEPYRLRNGFQVPKNWGILSFSSLAGHRDGEDKSGRGADEADADGSDVKSAVRDSSEASALPPGNVTGSCFHEIMEELDFTRICGESPQIWSGIPEIRALIEGKMRKFGLIGGNRNTDDDPLHRKRYAPLCAMIHHTLNTRITLGNKTFCLSEISPQDRIAEMDFFYEIIGGIKTGLLRETALSLLPDAFRDILKTDDPPALRRGGPSTGFMTGSIDLIFRVEGRYCFLDWKTNALPAYEERTLWRTMFRQGYALQYLIYSLALDRYLAQRLREYRFEDHFGGGIYAFVRGIESNGSGSDGILAHRIDPKIRSALEECIYGHHQVFDRRTQ